MAKTQTKAFTNQSPLVLPESGSPRWASIHIDFAATAYASGDLIELCTLPIGVRCVDWMIAFDDIDSNGSPAIAWSLGVENAGGTDLGSEVWGSGLTVGQTTAIARMTTNVAPVTGDTTAERVIALKCTTIAATYAGSGKTGRVLLLLRQ